MEKYEKLYKEALKKAKDMLSYKEEVRREDMEYLFPELEDERMKRELIAHFRNNSVSETWSGLNVKKVIAWLEKQDTEMKDVVSSMDVNSETEWDDIHKFLRMNLSGEKVKLLIIREE